MERAFQCSFLTFGAGAPCQVVALQQTRRPGQRTESWEKLREAVTLAREVNAGEDARRRLRNAAISTLARTDLQFRRTGPEDADVVTILGFDPPLNRYLRRDAHGNISLRRVDDDREVGSLPSTGFVNDDLLEVVSPRFSADGRWLALSYLGTNKLQGVDEVVIWDVEQCKVALVVPAKPRLAGADLSRDGTRLAICGNDCIVQVVDVPEGRTTARVEPDIRCRERCWHYARYAWRKYHRRQFCRNRYVGDWGLEQLDRDHVEQSQ